MPHAVLPTSAAPRAPVLMEGHCWPMSLQEIRKGRSSSVSCGGFCSFSSVLMCMRFRLHPLSVSVRSEI